MFAPTAWGWRAKLWAHTQLGGQDRNKGGPTSWRNAQERQLAWCKSGY